GFLKAFGEEHGHYNVPQSHGTLGVWVNNQRAAYKQRNMSEERIRQLEGIGFQWSLIQDWAVSFGFLKAFGEEHGHYNVPKSHGKLGRWVHNQREEYKRWRVGDPSPMSEERSRQLEGIGFQWSLKKDIDWYWAESFGFLKAFGEEHGHYNVPQSHGTLGRWVHNQHIEYKLWRDGDPSPMSEERFRQLEGIGFQWEVRRFWQVGVVSPTAERNDDDQDTFLRMVTGSGTLLEEFVRSVDKKYHVSMVPPHQLETEERVHQGLSMIIAFLLPENKQRRETKERNGLLENPQGHEDAFLFEVFLKAFSIIVKLYGVRRVLERPFYIYEVVVK
ncbi:hypothetical protein ACHAWF_000422, partial [Thalassiosira exigua]